MYIIFTYFVKKHVKQFSLNAFRELDIVISVVEQRETFNVRLKIYIYLCIYILAIALIYLILGISL